MKYVILEIWEKNIHVIFIYIHNDSQYIQIWYVSILGGVYNYIHHLYFKPFTQFKHLFVLHNSNKPFFLSPLQSLSPLSYLSTFFSHFIQLVHPTFFSHFIQLVHPISANLSFNVWVTLKLEHTVVNIYTQISAHRTNTRLIKIVKWTHSIKR